MTQSAFVLTTLASFGALFAPLKAQEAPAPPSNEPPLVFEDDGSRVSVLGYHEFHVSKRPTLMRIATSKLGEQMKKIKDSGIPVISMAQFLAWRRGQIEIPPKSFLITIDDGWKSVYTDAYPILKEHQFPFTIYLYKNYVGSHRGSRAMSLEMIKEMIDSGLCTIGSHSVSHPLPGDVKKVAASGPKRYLDFLKAEFEESKNFLDETFQDQVTTYAYPGGYHSEEMFSIADSLGYDHLFTVQPGKVKRDSNRHTLPRYIIHGTSDSVLNAAMSFRNIAGTRIGSSIASLPYPTSPNPGEIIASRLPTVSIDLSSVEDLDPQSVVMRVSGFGKVPVALNPRTMVFQWTISRPLRQPLCEVTAQWKLSSKNKYEPLVRWAFHLDHEATYQSK